MITIRVDQNGDCLFCRGGKSCDFFCWDGGGNEWCVMGWEDPKKPNKLHPGSKCVGPGNYELVDKDELEQMLSSLHTSQ